MKKEKGVTLLALVVTIILLLIIALVTINLVIGNNGLFARARKSVEHHKIEEYRETAEILRAKPEIEKGIN